MEIDKQFGDKELFKTLVKEAHARGIKVMLDAVFNHIGDTSAQWQDVLKNQENQNLRIGSMLIAGQQLTHQLMILKMRKMQLMILLPLPHTCQN